ncbi:hypothetical protein [Polyangium fumosum]|uniref:Uncharacterized protein n=1 Tax=Polyangium fumosum TaxID=889272 RepID=A0A4U1JG31_9BACT|nr:hypothetical protein [Polyangium fumosum]TKD09151.1 hypothetical protein E8A74_12760 [Polyangium fumosum]
MKVNPDPEKDAAEAAVICIVGMGAIFAAVFLALFTHAGPEPYVFILFALLFTPVALRLIEHDSE